MNDYLASFSKNSNIYFPSSDMTCSDINIFILSSFLRLTTYSDAAYVMLYRWLGMNLGQKKNTKAWGNVQVVGGKTVRK